MVLTSAIACRCISRSIAENRCCFTDSRAKRSTSQCVTSIQCDLMRCSWKKKKIHSEVMKELVWTKEWVWFALLQLACSCACIAVILWTGACATRLHACVSPRGENMEMLSVDAVLRVYSVRQPWHFAQAAMRRLLPRCGRRSGPLCISSSSSQKTRLLLQTSNTFSFSFTKPHRENFHLEN